MTTSGEPLAHLPIWSARPSPTVCRGGNSQALREVLARHVYDDTDMIRSDLLASIRS